jgi:hypothetical protein
MKKVCKILKQCKESCTPCSVYKVPPVCNGDFQFSLFGIVKKNRKGDFQTLARVKYELGISKMDAKISFIFSAYSLKD